MSDQGWIKLYRKIQSSFVWTNSDQLKLWLLILMKANHSQNKFLFNGKEISVSSGQFVTGRDALASEYNRGVKPVQVVVSRTIWRWVKLFEKSQMLSIESTSTNSVITVLNWGEYQESVQPVSSDCPADVQPVSTNKNDKNEKKKDMSAKPTIDYRKIIDYLNLQSGHKYRVTDKTRSLIHGRLAEGFTEHDFGLVIHYKSLEWKDSQEMSRYLRPNTLFAPSHFDDYVNEAREAAIKKQRASTSEPRGLTPEEGSARSARQLAELEEKYKNQGVSNE